MDLATFTESMTSHIEAGLQRILTRLNEPRTRLFHDILTYHMGWTGAGASPEKKGKRIRPLLALLSYCAASNEPDWQKILPASISIELIHNFSLIHDDIQDQSTMRHGRPTIWTLWGIPQAINAGDALFILARLVLSELNGHFPSEVLIKIGQLLDEACLGLTRGQFLDISYEEKTDLAIADYWPMVAGKAAAILSASAEIGSALGDIDRSLQEAYRNFGHYLGMAYQVKDDYLGIWGNAALTGKSTESDLLSGKKTYPVLYGLSLNGPFASRWKKGNIQPDEIISLAEQLAKDGVKLNTQEMVDQMTDMALSSLRAANPRNEAGEALFEMVDTLLNRQS